MKKFLAMLLTIIMVIESCIIGYAEEDTGDTSSAGSETISGGVFSTCTSTVKIEDRVELDIDILGGDTESNNVLTVIANMASGHDEFPGNDGVEGYTEYAYIRGDGLGWGNGYNMVDIVYDTEEVYSTNDENADGEINRTDDLIAVYRTSHIDAVFTKEDTTVYVEYYVTGANEHTLEFKAEVNIEEGDAYVYFMCDESTVTVSNIQGEEIGGNDEEDDNKGETTPDFEVIETKAIEIDEIEYTINIYGKLEGDFCWGTTEDWKLLYISGNGAMYNYDDETDTPPWSEYTHLFEEIFVEGQVTSVGNYTFRNMYNVSKVTLPDTVTRIGNGIQSIE